MTPVYIILIVALIILFVIAFYRQIGYYHTLTPVLGWLAGLFFFIVLPLTFIILNEGYVRPGYPKLYPLVGSITTQPAEFLMPFILVWIILALTNLVVIFFTPKSPLWHEDQEKQLNKGTLSLIQLKKILISSIVISFIFFAINIYLGGGFSNYFSQHWYYRFNDLSTQYGLIFTLYLKLYSANQVILAAASGLLVMAAIQNKWNKNYLLLAASVLTLVLNMVVSGNRIYVALLMIYLLAAMVSFLNPKKLIKYSLYLIPIVPIFSVWAYVRSNIANLSSALQNYVTTINLASSKVMTTLMDLTEGSDSMMLFKIIRDFGITIPLLHGQTYLKAITSVLPSSLGLSTKSFSIILANIYLPGLNVSANGTALGEMWANFGFLTLLFIPLFTFLIMRIGHSFYVHLEKRMLLNSVLFVLLIWMARSVFADNFQLFILSFLIIWGLGYEKNLYHLSTDH